MAGRPKKTDRVAREVEISGALCLAFANTAASRRDDRRRGSSPGIWLELKTYGDLLGWAQRMGIQLDGERLRRVAAEGPGEAAKALDDALKLRSALLGFFTDRVTGQSFRPEHWKILNAALARALPARRLVEQGDGFDWDWGGDDEDLDRMLWAVVQSAADFLTSDKLWRLRQCNSRGCFRLFIDRSGRRLWCDMNTCGSRAKGRRQQSLRRDEVRARAMSASPWRNGYPQRLDASQSAEDEVEDPLKPEDPTG